MPILTLDYLKQQIPEWEESCTLPPATPAPPAPATVFERRVASAEDELAEYVAVTEATITEPLRRHLVVLVRKSLFDLVHGSKPFDRTPQVVKDYERTLKALERYQAGEVSIEQPGQTTPAEDDTEPRYVTMTAKERRFNSWFR